VSLSRAYVDPDPQDRDPDNTDPYRDKQAAEGGTGADLLTGDEKTAAATVQKQWDDQSKLPETQQREARWKANQLRRQGYTGVTVWRDSDTAKWRVTIPYGTARSIPAFNKARTLCRTFVGNVFADPPAPLVEPTDGGDAGHDVDAAEVATRALLDLQGPRRLNTVPKARQAVDRACTYGSGFIRYWLDPQGGGQRPKTLEASPLATHAAHPFTDPETGQPHRMPDTPDPLTGEIVPGEIPDPVERYPHADGETLTDDATQAALEWRPALRSEVLTGRHVRFLPHTADSIREAHGVLIASFITWGQAKRMFPDLAQIKDEDKASLLSYKPPHADELLPKNRKGRKSGTQDGDEALVFTLTVVYRECSEYPDGFYGIALGGTRMPVREKWVAETEDRDGTPKREALLLPVAQFRLWQNGEDDPYGDGLMDDLGPVNEVRAAMMGHLLHHLEKTANMPWALPLQSSLNPERLFDGSPVIRVAQGQEPRPLSPAAFPMAEVQTVYAESGNEMDAAAHHAGTEDLTGGNVTSGRQAYQAVAQTHAQLSEVQQNIELGYIDCCQIELQQARVNHLDGEARYTGDDGAYKMQAWQGADLTGDVRLKPGTNTMVSPSMKQQMIDQWVLGGRLTPQQARKLSATGVGAMLGYEDEPYRVEIRRALNAWKDAGKTQGQQYQGPPPPQMVPGQPQMDPTTGAVVPGAPQSVPTPDPVYDALFPAKPCHREPQCATIRLEELGALMASTVYEAQPPAWRSLVDRAYQEAAAVLMPQPQAGMPAPGGARVARPPGRGRRRPRPRTRRRQRRKASGTPRVGCHHWTTRPRSRRKRCASRTRWRRVVS
jgi:hypothetical protein